MAGELLAHVRPGELFRETSLGYDTPYQSHVYGWNSTTGSSRGLSLQKILAPVNANLSGKEYYNGHWIVPAAVALATGLTFRFMLTDDGTDAADLGKVVQLEVTPYNLGTALAPVDWSLAASKGTATTGNATLQATSGMIVVLSIAIVVANLASLAAGGILGVRIRRVGDVAADTCAGRVIMLGGIITNT